MIIEAKWRCYNTPDIVLENPDALRQIHTDFFRAGSQVLQALTWFASPAQLDQLFGWGDRLDEVNRRAVHLAREASGGEALVAGCLISTRARGGKQWGRSVEAVFNPDDPSSHGRAQAEWDRQIAVMVDAGVDILMPEPFPRLDEVLLCLVCCKKTGLPTIVLMGLGRRTKTADGFSPGECARILADNGADVVGTGCIGDPQVMLPATLEMREAVDIPIAFQPNGYRAVGASLQTVQDVMVSSGDEMAEYAQKAVAEGINYIGACCGAGPEHIRAVARALGKERCPI